jgi:glycosyltransferase involved in cell wall biosynthesis
MHTTVTYALITAAHNEERFIEKTIRSVIAQRLRPCRWLIIENGSTDGTAEIVSRYAAEHSWIQLVQIDPPEKRNFGAKSHAFNTGLKMLGEVECDLIGNLDADISFDEGFFEFLTGKMAADPAIGVAGTVFEEPGYHSARDSFEGQNHVAGQCQLFRRKCIQQLGGYVPHSRGGIDWIAVTSARMLGWKTRSYREQSFFHHRHMGTADRGRIASSFAYGEKDYYLGGHPLWQMFRCAYRIAKEPYVIGGLALMAGYTWAAIRRIPRPVSPELMRFHRGEQMRKLRSILSRLLRFKRVDNFELASKGGE